MASSVDLERLKSRSYQNYVVGLLLLIYIVNFMDRQILNILLEPIKHDLQLNDTQLGLLSGIAFALFYATLGIPLARWADKHSRVNLITAAIVVWSGMTALCGAAANFSQLLVARIGVGIGEAGCSPPAHSLIADYMPQERRSRAMAIYNLGIPIGSLLGLALGGWINELYGWRVAFLAVGLPGVLLAILAKLTLREPPRGMADNAPPAKAEADEPSIGEVFKTLWQIRSYRYLALGSAMVSMIGYATATWMPSFMIRYHGMGTGEIGMWLALIGGSAGIVGTLAGGWLGDKLGPGDARWYAWLPALAMLIGIPFGIGGLLTDSKTALLLWIIIPTIAPQVYTAPVMGTVQTLAPLRMRAMAAGILFFVINLIGMGLGPFFVGFVSDLLAASVGDQSLRYTLLFGNVIAVISAVIYFIAARHLRADVAAAKARTQAESVQ